FQAHAHRHVLGHLNECVHDLVIDGLWNVQTLHRGTGLTSVNECAPEKALGDFLSVDIVKHNASVVAAELQGHARKGSGGGFHNLAAGLSGAGEHELVDVLAGRQSRADLAITGDDVENTFWKNTVDDLDQRQNRQWGVFGRLHDNCVTHAQCWGQLPYGTHHWPVPWANCANHAERTVEDLRGGLTVFHDGVVRGFKEGSSAQPRRTCADLEAGIRAVEWLALFARKQLRKGFCGSFDGIGSGEQQLIGPNARFEVGACSAWLRATASF